jgi:hypothetical protein
MLPNSSQSVNPSINPPINPLTFTQLLSRIQSLPPGPQLEQALLAFSKLYPGRKDLLVDHDKRQHYLNNPLDWVKDKLDETIWSKQVEMLNSVRDNKRTAVYSCHRIGKSYIFARVAFWWLDCHKPGEALVITTAHSNLQVKMALWREMNRVHAKGKFPGRMNQTEYWSPVGLNGKEEMIAFGRKPKDDDHTALQGTYSKYVLVLGDEAAYLQDPLWDGMDTLVSNEFSKVAVFGNPDDPNTRFAKVCSPGSGWNPIQVGYKDTPNFTSEDVPQDIKGMLISQEWVDQKKKDWGENSSMYISKVLGNFPENSVDSLIPISWIRAAQEKTLIPTLPIIIGSDVGGGGDKNVNYIRRGKVYRRIRSNQVDNTMTTLDNCITDIQTHRASQLRIDSIGIGRGASDRAKQITLDQHEVRERPVYVQSASKIMGVEVSSKASKPESFVNLRSEGYWNLRELFNPANGENIDIDPLDDDLANELVNIKYTTSNGRIQIESKKEMKARTKGKSPDNADSLMLASLETGQIVTEKKKKAKVY